MPADQLLAVRQALNSHDETQDEYGEERELNVEEPGDVLILAHAHVAIGHE